MILPFPVTRPLAPAGNTSDSSNAWDSATPKRIILEGGTGPLFDTYLRRMVNRVQGGYTYVDVPIFLSSSTGTLP
jgi:hypothetical protein